MIGKTISHYKTLKKIGERGMGVAYGSENIDKNHFLQGAKAAAGLNHPNIYVINEIKECEARQFIIMGYVHGQTLKEILLTKSLNLSRLIDYNIQIADFLTSFLFLVWCKFFGSNIIKRRIYYDYT